MKSNKLIVAVILISCLTGCRTRQVINHVQIDSTRTQVRNYVETRHRFVPVSIKLPDSYQQVYAEDSSYLENEYANSTARVTKYGLFHDLNSTPDTIIKEVMIADTFVFRDSVFYWHNVQVKEVPVKMPIPKWKRALMWLGIFLILFVIIKVTYWAKRTFML